MSGKVVRFRRPTRTASSMRAPRSDTAISDEPDQFVRVVLKVTRLYGSRPVALKVIEERLDALLNDAEPDRGA